VPFLDYRLVEFALRQPADRLLSDGWNKRLLREAMRGRIPEPVRVRPEKFGFPTPQADWMRKEWYDSIMELVHDRALLETGLMNPVRLADDVARWRAGSLDCGEKLFRVAQLSLWLQTAVRDEPRTVGSRAAGVLVP
jgi:asparagine synthase (glutamine-hydrolysing)